MKKKQFEESLMKLDQERCIPHWEGELKNNNFEAYEIIKRNLSKLTLISEIKLEMIRKWFTDLGFPLEDYNGNSASMYSAVIKFDLLLRIDRATYENFYGKWLHMYQNIINDIKLNEVVKILWENVFNEVISDFEVGTLNSYIYASKNLINYRNNTKTIFHSTQLLTKVKERLKVKYRSLDSQYKVDIPKIRFENPYVIISNYQFKGSPDNEYKTNLSQKELHFMTNLKRHFSELQSNTDCFKLNRCFENSKIVFNYIKTLKENGDIPSETLNQICLGTFTHTIPFGSIIYDDFINYSEFCLYEVKHAWNRLNGILVDLTCFSEGMLTQSLDEWGYTEKHVFINPPKHSEYQGQSYNTLNEFDRAISKST